MTTYTITNKISGAHLGEYDGETAVDALDAMARDAGYRDIDEACEVVGAEDDLDVRPVSSWTVTARIREAFRASKAAGNDDGAAYEDVNETIAALVGDRTGTLDQETLTWTFD